MHRTALDRAGPDQRDLHDEVVETARPQARQRRHLRPALDLEHADGVGRATTSRRPLLPAGSSRGRSSTPWLAHHVDREVQHRQHAQAEQVELHESGRRAVVLVPLQHRAAFHARPFDRAELDAAGGRPSPCRPSGCRDGAGSRAPPARAASASGGIAGGRVDASGGPSSGTPSRVRSCSRSLEPLLVPRSACEAERATPSRRELAYPAA